MIHRRLDELALLGAGLICAYMLLMSWTVGGLDQDVALHPLFVLPPTVVAAVPWWVVAFGKSSSRYGPWGLTFVRTFAVLVLCLYGLSAGLPAFSDDGLSSYHPFFVLWFAVITVVPWVLFASVVRLDDERRGWRAGVLRLAALVFVVLTPFVMTSGAPQQVRLSLSASSLDEYVRIHAVSSERECGNSAGQIVGLYSVGCAYRGKFSDVVRVRVSDHLTPDCAQAMLLVRDPYSGKWKLKRHELD